MATLTLQVNAAIATNTLVPDLGIIVPGTGTLVFTNQDDILAAQQSTDLRVFLTDNSQTGTSTLQIVSGSAIAQADALNFLDTLLLPNAVSNYGVVKTNASAQIDQALTFDGIATINAAILGSDLNANSNKVTNVTAGIAGTDAVNVTQLNAVAAAGKIWKEVVLDAGQLLDGASGGINSAGVFWLQDQPTANNTLVLKSTAGGTETFTAVATTAVAFDWGIGASTDNTLANLVTAINADSVTWSAVLVTTFNKLNDGTGTVTAGQAVVIYEKVATDTDDSRIYGTFTSGVPKYVNYFGEVDYASSTVAALPAADPAQREFGFGRAFANLTTNETHVIRSDDTVKTWDTGGSAWQDTGANGVVAGDGIVKTGNVISADYGLVGDIQSLGSTVAAGISILLARADHVHTHGDRGVDGAVSEHDAQQVDVVGTYARISAPGTTEAVLSAINADFGNGRYVGKLLDYGAEKEVPDSGTRYLESAGQVKSSAVGKRLIRAGVISALSFQTDDNTDTNTYTLTVEKSSDNGSTWTSISTLALPATTYGVHTITPAGTLAYAAGDVLRVSVVRATGTGKSTFENMTASVEINEG